MTKEYEINHGELVPEHYSQFSEMNLSEKRSRLLREGEQETFDELCKAKAESWKEYLKRNPEPGF